MRKVSLGILAGVAALASVGVYAAARAADAHMLTVQLPGGGVEQITYTGDVAPGVVFSPAVDVAAPWVAFDQISAQMDREMAAMMQEANALAADGLAALTQAALTQEGAPGGESYVEVTQVSSKGVCTRTTEVTQAADGGAPKLVSSTSGACGTPAAPRPKAVGPL